MTVLRDLRTLQCMFTTKMKAYFQPWIPYSIFKTVLTKVSVFSMKIVKIKKTLFEPFQLWEEWDAWDWTTPWHRMCPQLYSSCLAGVFRSASEPLLCSPNLCYSPSLKRYFSYTSLCTVYYCELFTQRHFQS